MIPTESKPGVSDVHSAELHLDTICLVFPLRLGTLLTATATFLFSAFTLLGKDSFQDFMRHFIGGYSLKARLALYVIEVTGLVFGLCGMIGTWYCKKSYIVWFNLWQVARLFGFLYMYKNDLPLLTQCEQWINDVDGMTKKYGWNQILYDNAMNASCATERDLFYICSFTTFLFFMYLIWCVNRYCNECQRVPKHLLRIPKDLTSGAWYAHSLGERNYMNGMWGKHEIHEQVPLFQQSPQAYAAAHPDMPFGEAINDPTIDNPNAIIPGGVFAA
mmetsp:Transcript_2738/g.4561  ORF Transcript_2738/g.4561 Transcript_2738/m.4561 type:complete len:274 (-) Transcript_2738:22-843(-)